ncbi:hypothetical protein EDC28_101187 [Gallaecimonas pentaromativorans]|uniref:Lipoprotein n=2 Tax=Gallaecimonas pentaromativorans TaxID=584787 RepID=A0A3N1PTS0_9GAMM|nr:hypothetical protein EDC28_101187 [Gallaecimonas pentaromativorans]
MRFLYTSILVSLSLISGCTQTPVKKLKVYQVQPKQEGQFVTTRVNISFPKQDDVNTTFRLRYNAKGILTDSLAFSEIDEVNDSPYVLDIAISGEGLDDSIDMAKQIASAATLFLIPTESKGRWIVDATLSSYGVTVQHYKITENYNNRISITTGYSTQKSSEQLALEKAMHHLINEIRADKAIPLVIPNIDMLSAPHLDFK